MMTSDQSVRSFPSGHYGGQIIASQIELRDAHRVPGTFGWLTRFTLIAAGETALRWPTINAVYVDGILDVEGNWQADFPEPTIGNPTVF